MGKQADRPSRQQTQASRADLVLGDESRLEKPMFRNLNGEDQFNPAHVVKLVGGREYSLEPSSMRPETCKPPRNGFERLRKGMGTSKHFGNGPSSQPFPRIDRARNCGKD